MFNINWLFVVAYFSAFAYCVLQRHLMKWGIASLIFMISTIVFFILFGDKLAFSYGQRLGLIAILYCPQIFIVPTSLFALFNIQQSEARFFKLGEINHFPALFIMAAWLQWLSFLVLLALVWWQYPAVMSIYGLAALLDLFFLQPAFWICSHFYLIFCLWLYQRLQKRDEFSVAQCEIVFLIALILQVLFVLRSIIH